MNPAKAFFALLLVLMLMGAGFAHADDTPAPNQVAQVGGMAGAATSPSSEDAYSDFGDFDTYGDEVAVPDPLIGFNKAMFYFNDTLYHSVYRPTAQGYAWLVPAKPRQWVRNFFTNLLYPVRFVNNILQGKFDAAGMETSKFIANTAWGFLGLGDVTAGMPRNWEPERPTAVGFGQTLGKAGLGHGFYVVWPIIGPSSARESVGWVADAYMDPLTYTDMTFIEFGAVRVYKNLNELSLQLTGNEYEALTEGAIDKYAAVRDAYLRYTAKKVQE